MKRMTVIGLSIILSVVMCACGAQNSPAPVSPASKTDSSQGGSASGVGEPSSSANIGGIDNSETAIGVMTQEYIGDNIGEVLMITYDGSQPALEEFGGKNPEIEMFNNLVKNGVQQIYWDFMDNQTEDSYEWIEMKSYPFTSDDYLQIVTHYIVYPTYGSSGDVESFNFNKKENRCVTLDDAMSELGLTREDITQKVVDLYEPFYEPMSVSEVETAGFLILEDGAGPYTVFLLEVLLDNPDGEPWRGIFEYIPKSEELYELGTMPMFDPLDLDVMDPPLYYGLGSDEVYDLAYEEEIGQGIYYYEFYALQGDPGDGLSVREGAELVITDLLPSLGFFDGLDSSEQTVHISFDDLQFVDAAQGQECYIYTVGVGTYEGGFYGEGYEDVMRVAVNYGERIAFVFED